MSGTAAELTRVLSVVAELRKEIMALRGEVLRLEGRIIELESKPGVPDFESEFDLVSVRSESCAAPSITPERQVILRGIGAFLRRCLIGEHRGASGRDKLPEASRVYLVCQGFDCERFNPPRVFHSWAAAKGLVIRKGSPGPSIFVGLPSSEEALIVVESAGLETPTALLQ